MGELPKYDEKSALLVVHVQNDFADPNGSLQVERGEQILPLVNHEIDRATGAGAFVVYTRHWHRPSTPHFAIHAGKWPVLCVRDTSGADLQAELKVVGDRIRKALARRTATPASAASTSRAVTGTATASTTCSTQRNRADRDRRPRDLVLDTYDTETAAYRVAELADELRRDHARHPRFASIRAISTR